MEQRTIPQNKSLHLLFTQLANELNDSGLYANVILKPSYQINWSAETVKRDLFCQLSKAMFNKEHTSELTKKEVNQVYEQLMQILGEKHGFYLEFPSSIPPLLEEI